MLLRDQVEAQLSGILADLTDLVAIESVSADPSRTAEVERSAQRVAQLLADLGCPDIRVVHADGGAPAVIGRFLRLAACRPSASTPTMTSNRRATQTAGVHRPLSRPSAMGGFMAAA